MSITLTTVPEPSSVGTSQITDLTILDADVSASAAIAYSKLAALTSAHILVGNASNVATDVAVTGDVTITNGGVTAIGSGKVTSANIVDGAIVNADINGSAAIAASKLAFTPTAFTQTYSTATATVPNATAANVATTASGLASFGYAQAQADAIPVAINATQADVLALAKVINSVIDTLQANGIAT